MQDADEDEDVDALLLVLDAAVESDRNISKEQRVLAKLLTKVHAFVTKVCSILVILFFGWFLSQPIDD